MCYLTLRYLNFSLLLYIHFIIYILLCLLSAQQRMDVKSLQEQYTGANELLMFTQSDYLMDFTV